MGRKSDWPISESEYRRKSGPQFAHRIEVEVFQLQASDNPKLGRILIFGRSQRLKLKLGIAS